jgi:hypothetical protein
MGRVGDLRVRLQKLDAKAQVGFAKRFYVEAAAVELPEALKERRKIFTSTLYENVSGRALAARSAPRAAGAAHSPETQCRDRSAVTRIPFARQVLG